MSDHHILRLTLQFLQRLRRAAGDRDHPVVRARHKGLDLQPPRVIAYQKNMPWHGLPKKLVFVSLHITPEGPICPASRHSTRVHIQQKLRWPEM
ncbi:MAG: hypothetical protein WDM77_05140 [Steroidobacteraceae bacterium]